MKNLSLVVCLCYMFLFMTLLLSEESNEIYTSRNKVEPDIDLKSRPIVYNKDLVLQKTSFSNQTRLFIVAGLEGTGHHAFTFMLQECGNMKPALCEPHYGITKNTMHKYVLQNGQWKDEYVSGLFGSTGLENTSDYINNVLKEMKTTAYLPGNHLFFLGLAWVKQAGHYSYPNFNSKFKSLDHPDISI